MRSPTTCWAWTWGRSRSTCSALSWSTRGPSSGTVPWESSSWRRSPPAPRASPRLCPPSTGSPWSAVATRRPRRGSSSSTSRPTATSAPAAVRPWSTSRAGSSLASRCSPTEAGADMARRGAAPARREGRRPLIAGNWKMNMTHLDAIGLVQKVVFSLKEPELEAAEVVVLPPFTALRSVQTLVTGDKLEIGYGAQDLSAHDSGAYTGEISGGMLAALACQYVTVGHSERRALHGEDDAVVAAKTRAALRHGIVPIVCVGEGLEVRQAGGHVAHCCGQMDHTLDGLSPEQIAGLVIAYEPVWAIGTGEVATPADAQEVCGALRARLAERFGQQVADEVRILYGGSVKSGNIGDLVKQDDIDGALVGGASLDAEDFTKLCALAAGGPLP